MRVSLIVINCSDVTDVQVPLRYWPLPYHAVTCTSDHLLVAARHPSPAIAIHSWAGQQSQVITGQQLGLEWEEIRAVSYSQMSRTLHVAARRVGVYANVHSLRTCQVSERTASVDTRRYSHRLQQRPRFALYLACY